MSSEPDMFEQLWTCRFPPPTADKETVVELDMLRDSVRRDLQQIAACSMSDLPTQLVLYGYTFAISYIRIGAERMILADVQWRGSLYLQVLVSPRP